MIKTNVEWRVMPRTIQFIVTRELHCFKMKTDCVLKRCVLLYVDLD